jgi:hypothetical protein
MPRSGPGPVMGWPSSVTNPVSGVSSPAKIFNSVDLPH